MKSMMYKILDLLQANITIANQMNFFRNFNKF